MATAANPVVKLTAWLNRNFSSRNRLRDWESSGVDNLDSSSIQLSRFRLTESVGERAVGRLVALRIIDFLSSIRDSPGEDVEFRVWEAIESGVIQPWKVLDQHFSRDVSRPISQKKSCILGERSIIEDQEEFAPSRRNGLDSVGNSRWEVPKIPFVDV